jgi:signal transduction histidine kinase
MSTKEKVNILLVDDQPGKLLSYQVMLHQLDENLIKASSGKEALSVLLKTEVAVRIGVGLGGMRERARQFDGDFRVSNANPGTLVEVAIPFSVQNRNTKRITQSLWVVPGERIACS